MSMLYGFVLDAGTLCWDCVVTIFEGFKVQEAYYTTPSGAREPFDDFTYSTGIVFKVLSLIVLCIVYRYIRTLQLALELEMEIPIDDNDRYDDNDHHELHGKMSTGCEECQTCVICKDRKKNVLIIPCNHVCLCLSCYDELRQNQNTCPICREIIQEMKRVYL